MYSLTKQEVCVLTLVAEGLTNNKIAQELNISVATVKTHLESIYLKLDAHNKVQAVVNAVKFNIIEI